MSKQTFTVGQVLTASQMTSLQQTAMGGGSTTAKTTSYVLVAADAGTVVQMNAAGATTITVNTALFAAGDSVQIQNVGAGVCTVTTGTATVNTSATLALKQYDAGTLYFNTTSAAFFFAVDAADAGGSPLTTKGDLYGFSTLDARIPIGTNNQVLTADSAQALGLKWATPSAGGAVSHVRAISSTTSIPASTWTKVIFATESYDTLSEFASSRFTAASTGYYNVSAGANSDAGSIQLGSQMIVAIYKNGTAFQLGSSYTYPGNVTARGSAFISTGLSLTATDYIEIYVLQSLTGSALSLATNDGPQTFVSIDRLQD